MAGWRDRVGDLLYDGESVEETVDFDEASVVVTSHRVLAFDPEGDGPTLQQADRPNVEGVTTGARSETDLLRRGAKTGVVGLVLLGTGLAVDFGSIVGDVNVDGETAQQVGMGGLFGAVQSMLDFVAQLDFLLRVFGALALFLAAVFLAVYWFTRDPTLVVEIAGDDDIQLPQPAADGVPERVEGAVAIDPSDTSREADPPGDPLGEA